MVAQTPTRVETVLVEAERDLDNADFRHLSFVLNALRFCVWRPALGVAEAVLPPVAGLLPALDGPASVALSVPFDAARKVYGAAHAGQFNAKWRTHRDAEAAFRELLADPAVEEELLRQKSELHTLRGFIISATIELVSDPIANVGQWLGYTKQLLSYLKSQGIEKELKETQKSDRLLLNMRVLGNVMAVEDNTEIRRRNTVIPGAAFTVSPKVVAKLMRYCCAAYGEQMMQAADMIAKKNGTEMSAAYKKMVGSEALKQQVCDHVGIPTSYVTYFCMGHGGSMKLLRHYISVDHELRAVVLVIRGTYSVSGWHIDFQGQGTEFCGGIAHMGISEMAKAIVKNSRDHIVDALTRYPEYKLMITGQSLGGGVSPLVNLLCHRDSMIGKRSIECHAFAGPPVYSNVNDLPDIAKAMSHCTHYVHGDDVVPYLSVHTVRRINAKLVAMDGVTGKAGFVDAQLTAMGRKTPSPEMVSAAKYGDAKVQPIPGGPVLMTPCKEVVWFREGADGGVDYTVCDPTKHSELGILLTSKGFSDHVPPKYETVLNKAAVEGWTQSDGF